MNNVINDDLNKPEDVIELEDGDLYTFEIKQAKTIDEGFENLIKVYNKIVNNGGKTPKIKCVICGLSNVAYQQSDGVYAVHIIALKN